MLTLVRTRKEAARVEAAVALEPEDLAEPGVLQKCRSTVEAVLDGLRVEEARLRREIAERTLRLADTETSIAAFELAARRLKGQPAGDAEAAHGGA